MRFVRVFCAVIVVVCITGIDSWADETWEVFRGYNSIRSVASDGEYVWCGNRHGVIRWNLSDSSYEVFGIDAGYTGGDISQMVIDSNGVLHAWSPAYGLYALQDGIWSEQTVEGLDSESSVYVLKYDADGNLWIAGSALMYYDGIGYHNIEGFSAKIIDMDFDSSGNIWMVASNKKVCKYDGETFEVITSFSLDSGESLNLDAVRIAVDNNDTVWIGDNTHGLVKYDGDSYTIHSVEDGLPESVGFGYKLLEKPALFTEPRDKSSSTVFRRESPRRYLYAV